MKSYLSKSKYTAFRQCPKILWMKTYKPEEETIDPALFPDDSQLNYANLTGSVHNGGEAMTIFSKIKDMSPEEQQKARQSLLDYCHLDTLAMVKIWQKLEEVSR